MDSSQTVSLAEAAEIVGVTPNTVYTWYWSRRLQAIPVEGRLVTTVAEAHRVADEIGRSGRGRRGPRGRLVKTEPGNAGAVLSNT